MTVDFAARQAKLSALADAVAIVPGTSMQYFTGLDFHLSERPIVAIFMGDRLSFICPELEVPKLRDGLGDREIEIFRWTDEDWYEGAFIEAVATLGLAGASLALDDMTMRVFEWLAFQRGAGRMGLTPVGVGQDILHIRAIKEPGEVELIRKAIQISEQALARTLHQVEPGMSEREISNLLEKELTSGGAQGLSFAPLVLVGERAALPHGNSGERELGQDETLLIDFGGLWNGYPADITRTFCLGEPSDQLNELYDLVLRANRAAIAVAGPGVPCQEVDRAARDIITEAGYGEYFIHRLGHGLGLDVHELPQMANGIEATLEEGMVFTVEPGVYISGEVGVRVEDICLVTADGVEVLTSFPRALNELG